MGKFSRNKGARGEREVVNILRAAGFDTAFRTGEYVTSDILCGIDGYDRIIEVKVRARGFSSLYSFLKDAFLVVHKADRKEWLVTLTFSDFLSLKGPNLKIEEDTNG